MYHPTTRVLTLLELLQSRGTLTGAEIAQSLEVNIRTARRCIAMLEDLGVPSDVATIEEIEDGCVLLRGYTDNADWMARILARAGCPLEIRKPPELWEALRRHAAQILLWADDRTEF